jgi:hypothetical protein
MPEVTRRPGESLSDYEKRRRGAAAGLVQKSPEQVRQEALYRAETKRLAEEAAMPQLEDYQGISSLEGGGKLTAKSLTGADIQKQMEESPWYKMALEKQGSEQARLMDQAARQQAGAMAGARSQLAMRGGLGGGAAERMATAGAGNLAEAMQQQRQGGAVERGQLGMQGADLASKISQFNVGQQAETEKANLQTQLLDLQARENRKLQQYGERMKGYAAEQTSQGIGSGGKK